MQAEPLTSPGSPRVILLTGNMAAGKLSVAQALAERLPRSVHLRGDLFRRLIVNGRAEMDFVLSDEAARQLDLRYRLAASAARLYLEAGFTVVVQDIVIGPALARVAGLYDGPSASPSSCCAPGPDVVAARDAARAKTGYPDPDAVLAFDHVLREQTPRLGWWLDTSDLSVEQTVERICDQLSLYPTGTPRSIIRRSSTAPLQGTACCSTIHCASCQVSSVNVLVLSGPKSDAAGIDEEPALPQAPERRVRMAERDHVASTEP
jgi:predicted kinase